jgi:glycosyltransferase involved in cell wall biosynthesis
MTIAFDIRPIVKKQKTGIGFAAYWTIRSIQSLYDENNFVLNFFAFGNKIKIKKRIESVKSNKTILNGCFYFPDTLFRALSIIFPVPYSKFFRKYSDLTHFFDFVVPFGVRGKKILTVHDMSFFAYPKETRLRTKLLLKIYIKMSCKRADKIVTVSEFSKKEIIKYLNISPDKIHVVPNGVNTEKYFPIKNNDSIKSVKEKYSINNKYFLYLGTLEPRKNIVRLLEAYKKLKTSEDIPDLILAGKKGWLYRDIFECIHRLKLEKSVIYIGYLSDDDIVPIICGAIAFLFPSLYEGFGMPPLEAMACGTPVLTSNVSSLPEIVGDAALLVDPQNVDDIYEKLKMLVSNDDLRNKLIRRGLERASIFSWDNAAAKMMELYEKVVLDVNNIKL